MRYWSQRPRRSLPAAPAVTDLGRDRGRNAKAIDCLDEITATAMFKARLRLEAENFFLRHQLSISLRRAPPRLRLRGGDRALLVWMTRLSASLLGVAQVVQPETILRWHRTGFTAFWRWKSRNRAGRPKIDRGTRDLIQRMSKENSQWGAARIHGELLMFGYEVAQSTVSKYMVRPPKPPSQSWKTFLQNHAEAIAAIDLCVVPTLTFERLFAFLVRQIDPCRWSRDRGGGLPGQRGEHDPVRMSLMIDASSALSSTK